MATPRDDTMEIDRPRACPEDPKDYDSNEPESMDVDEVEHYPLERTSRHDSAIEVVPEDQKLRKARSETNARSGRRQYKSIDIGFEKVSEDTSKFPTSEKSKVSDEDDSASQKSMLATLHTNVERPKNLSRIREDIEAEWAIGGYEYILFGVKEEHMQVRAKSYKGHPSLRTERPWPVGLDPPMPVPEKFRLVHPIR